MIPPSGKTDDSLLGKKRSIQKLLPGPKSSA
jgi:hypothetical protein